MAAPASAQAALELLPSAYACPETVLPGAKKTQYRTCTFSNLYLWQGKAYYIVEDSQSDYVPINKLGLRFELWADLEQPRTIFEFMQPIRAGAFRHLLAATAPAGRAPGSAAAELPLVYFFKARKLGPGTPEYTCDNVPAAKTNYYHWLAEWLPAMSYTLCELFGRCSYEDRKGLQIIDVMQRPGHARSVVHAGWTGRRCHRRELYPAWVQEAVACLSDRPLHHINGTALRGQLSRIRTAWVGLGPRCRGKPAGCYEAGSGHLPPTPELTAAWRTLVNRCFRQDAQRQSALEPLQLLVVDRLVVRALQARYSPQHVRVSMAYMEGLTVQQQADLWGRASVVLHMHGACVGNYFFLPKNAVTVQIGPYMDTYENDVFTGFMQSDLQGVSDVETIEHVNADPSQAHLITEGSQAVALWRKPEMKRLVARRDVWGELMATYRCPQRLASSASREDQLLYRACQSALCHLNIVLDTQLAANLTDAAIRRAYAKQGRAVPPTLLAQAAGSGAAAAAAAGSVSSAADAGTGGGGAKRVAAAAGLRHQLAAAGATTQAAALVRTAGGTQLLLLGVAIGAAAWGLLSSLLPRRKDP
ncbi:hypothetical protein ABPG75_005025 [Micractinium tetrahymenae]